MNDTRPRDGTSRLMGGAPRRVVFLVLPGVHALDLAGPLQVFDTANEFGPHYDLQYAASTTEVRGAQGLTYAHLPPLPTVQAGDTVVVPGVRIWQTGQPTSRPPGVTTDAPTRAWLRHAHEAGARVTSVCAGALALAEAGLLDGRKCTTHWYLTKHLQTRHPRAHVVENALFVHDGPITTSAGVASGIDMALSLVERDLGPRLTALVARSLVVYVRRDGTHGQGSVYLEYRTHLHPGVHRAQDHLCAHPTEKVTLADLARVANMSERTLARAFKEATNLTPLQYQHLLRLEVARTLLHDPHLTLEAVAYRAGFEDARHFRRLWTRHHGAPPSASRASVTARA